MKKKSTNSWLSTRKTVPAKVPTGGRGHHYQAQLEDLFNSPWGELDPVTDRPERPLAQWEVLAGIRNRGYSVKFTGENRA